MKRKTILRWNKNLESMVTRILEGGCHKKEIPRHCNDFLREYRRVMAGEIVEELLKD